MSSNNNSIQFDNSELVILLQCVREKRSRSRAKDGKTRITTLLMGTVLNTIEAKILAELKAS